MPLAVVTVLSCQAPPHHHQMMMMSHYLCYH